MSDGPSQMPMYVNVLVLAIAFVNFIVSVISWLRKGGGQ